MDTKKLLSSTVLYGFGDVVVLAVSGFLLMPLYTRSLSQADYGIYIITKTNTDIFTYLIHFGLITAVSRLYFDYKKKGEHFEYLSSVLLFFIAVSALFAVAMYFCGDIVWSALSPKVGAYPYLWFCVAIAFFNFFSYFSSAWLRVEEKASKFVAVQLASALLLLGLVLYNLMAVHRGLMGLLESLLTSSVLSAAVLPLLFRRRLKFSVKTEHVTESLRFALPVVVGYCAYFVLNRVSTLVLQRYVPVEKVAVFGLGQQMAMIVTIASNAFAKSLQPMIFAAEREEVQRLVERSGRLYLLLMSCIINLGILFASDILQLAAPPRYSGGYYVFLIMILANFIFSVSFISDSILLYYRFPMTSVGISLFGGTLSLILCLVLVPRYEMYGAAFSSLIAFLGVLAAGFYTTRDLVRHSGFSYLARLMPLTAVMVACAVLLRDAGTGLLLSLCIKGVLACLLLFATYHQYSRTAEVTA